MTGHYSHFFHSRYCFICFKTFSITLALLLCMCCSKNNVQNQGTVYIEHTKNGWELYRNNKPFKIKGASASNRFKELKAAGANTVRIYDTTNLKSVLDSAHFYDLAVIVDLPIRRYVSKDTLYADAIFKAQELNATKRTVTNFKNHPALLYWILGNEVNYPDNPLNNTFVIHYNELLKAIRLADTNHPISTSVGGFDRSRVLAIKTFSPLIDLISINIFGELSTFEVRRDKISWLWNGPYVLTEFGINGPWEASKTTWAAPIEETSTKKAEQYYKRYRDYIQNSNSNRCLGSLFFYWGNKQERTHTWFSTFDEEGRFNESVLTMKNIWKNENNIFEGPKIKHILLNDKGAKESIVLKPEETVTSKLLMENAEILKTAKVSWEVRKENWNYLFNEIEKRPEKLSYKIFSQTNETLVWKAPKEEGPYRIFITIIDGETFATSNIPFYILP